MRWSAIRLLRMDRQVETTTSVRKFNGVGVIGPGCSLVALSRRDGRHRDAPHLVTLPVEARQLGEENVVLTVTLSEMRGHAAFYPALGFIVRVERRRSYFVRRLRATGCLIQQMSSGLSGGSSIRLSRNH